MSEKVCYRVTLVVHTLWFLRRVGDSDCYYFIYFFIFLL